MTRYFSFFVCALGGLLLSGCETPSANAEKTPVALSTKANAKVAAPDTNTKTNQPNSVATPKVSAQAATPGASSRASESPQVAAVEEVPKIKPEQWLAEGTQAFDKGDYKGAIRKLQMVNDASDASTATRVASLKVMAFSYCVSNQRPMCKTQFVQLLRLAPTFELARAEAGHPLWGPVFREAKFASSAKPRKAG